MNIYSYAITVLVAGLLLGCGARNEQTQVERAQQNLQRVREEAATKIHEAETHLAATIMNTEKQIEKAREAERRQLRDEQDTTRSGAPTGVE